jgi:uncharacterized protein (TIGR04255 family)
MFEDVCYKKSYLTDVVARIDFVAPVLIFEKTLPSKVSDAIVSKFPIVEPADLVAFGFEFGSAGSKTEETRSKQWQFFGKNREKQLTFSPPSMILQYRQYSTFEQLQSEFSLAIQALSKTAPDARVQRFGLRYINKIALEKCDESVEFRRARYPRATLHSKLL